jgi:hypothetical protein
MRGPSSAAVPQKQASHSPPAAEAFAADTYSSGTATTLSQCAHFALAQKASRRSVNGPRTLISSPPSASSPSSASGL